MKSKGVPAAVLGDRHLAGPPDLHQPDQPVRRLAVQRRHHQGDLRLRRRASRRSTWYAGHIHEGFSPKNVANDAQAQAFRQGRDAMTWDGIWMMNEWAKVQGLRVGRRAAADHRREAGRVGELAQPDDHAAEEAGREQAPGRPRLHRLPQRELHRVGEVGPDPGAQQRPREPRVRRAEVQSTLAKQLDDVVFFPTIPGIGDITTPTFETAVNTVVLGKAKPKDALSRRGQEGQRPARGQPQEVLGLMAGTATEPASSRGRRPGRDTVSAPDVVPGAVKSPTAASPLTAYLFLLAVPGAVRHCSCWPRSSTACGSACTSGTSCCPASRSSACRTTSTCSRPARPPRARSGPPCGPPRSSRS